MPETGTNSIPYYLTNAGQSIGGTVDYTGLIWTSWVSNSTTTGFTQTAANLTQIWTTWVNQTTVDPRQGYGSRIGEIRMTPQAPRELTAEEVAARQAAIQRSAEHAAAAQREMAEARARAAALLEEHLSEEQRVTWRERKVIDLTSERNKRYRISGHSIAGNVYELNEAGKVVASLCAHPDNVPLEDVILTQLLALSYCEDHFREVANHRIITTLEGLPQGFAA
jgi:hypothetical protein